jgi:transglutaminase-like putative cysteine protease
MVAALAVTGLQPRLLAPGHWPELGEGLERGLAGLNDFSWPYDESGSWVRLTILLLMPVLAVIAAALAFWPARRFAPIVRAAALLPLLLVYGTGVTNLDPSDNWALRGGGLLLLVAAYLWLPRLRPGDTLLATAAVVACGFASLPLAAGFDAREPWVDYRTWEWFTARDAGTRFAWDHVYGPITWSRAGTMLIEVRSPEPHYWRAQTLDRFDGLRWTHSESMAGGDATEDIPVPIPPRWDEEVSVTVRELNSRLVIGAGTIYRTDLDTPVADYPDGTVRLLDDEPLERGETYTVNAYVPDPSAERMRAAPRAFSERLLDYTRFGLPAPGASGLEQPDPDSPSPPVERTVGPPVAGVPLTFLSEQTVLDSPYARMYRLAKDLAAGQPTTYDVVKATERYFQRDFVYDEKPPARRYPLTAFLFDDKRGYCQQFSGAMALMLRMNGIPARVATGFSPGALNQETGRYEVRDFDAHSWVEVWFSGIGWVPFDPTPSTAPAGAQSNAADAASAARGGRGEDITAALGTRQREAIGGGGGATADNGSQLWPVLIALAALAIAILGGLWLTGILRARPHFPATDEGAVQELRAALRRLGYSYPDRTTLSELERRLRVTGAEPAARYVSMLRAARYAPPGSAAPPGQRERRELRRALTAGGGPLARLRGLVALPPHPRRRAF